MHFQGVVKKMTTEYSSTINLFIEYKNNYINLIQYLRNKISFNCYG